MKNKDYLPSDSWLTIDELYAWAKENGLLHRPLVKNYRYQMLPIVSAEVLEGGYINLSVNNHQTQKQKIELEAESNEL